MLQYLLIFGLDVLFLESISPTSRGRGGARRMMTTITFLERCGYKSAEESEAALKIFASHCFNIKAAE